MREVHQHRIHRGHEGRGEEQPTPGPIPRPQCGAPAQITERFWLTSTDGPVEHVQIGCANDHWFTPPAETVTGVKPEPIPAAVEGVPA